MLSAPFPARAEARQRSISTLPSGYRTTTYHGRSYYTYGGAYYRPYSYRGAHYYYPVPAPYYSYYSSPPPGAVMLMVAGVAYLMSQDGSYSKQTTNSQGQVVYQTVPAPEGAKIKTLPAERVLVTVSATTFYLYSNTFYRRVMDGDQETFVVVTPPAGVVFIQALPADFEVVQYNTMYFSASGRFYVPYLSADGNEMYVMVDRPPTPPAAPSAGPAATTTETPAAASTAATAPSTASEGPAVQAVADSVVVPAGTALHVRLAAEVSSATAQEGYRFQGFLDEDLAQDGRFVAARGSRVFGVVEAVGAADQPSLTLTLTDLQTGSTVASVKTHPLVVEGHPAVVPAQSPRAFTLAAPLEVNAMSNVAVR